MASTGRNQYPTRSHAARLHQRVLSFLPHVCGAETHTPYAGLKVTPGRRRLRDAEVKKERSFSALNNIQRWLGWRAWGFQSPNNLCFIHCQVLIVFTGPNVIFYLKVFYYINNNSLWRAWHRL